MRRTLRDLGRALVFTAKVLPMLPSRPLDWVTPPFTVERVAYATHLGVTTGGLYRPATRGRHPGVAVCLGVVPFGTDHPQVPRLGEALARAGFAALLYWSPAMRDMRLDPADAHDLALAYDTLLARPDVDPARSGLLGTCVGGSFALMAAADPLVRDRVAFVAAFAPYSSMWTLLRDIASGTTVAGLRGSSGAGQPAPWPVDPLTRQVFVRSLTALLEPAEAATLGAACALPGGFVGADALSDDARAVYPLLRGLPPHEAAAALEALPPRMRSYIDALTPLHHLPGVCAPLVAFGHDASDTVIPVAESRRLAAALAGRAGAKYTEFNMFQHADPTKRKLSPQRFAREVAGFFQYLYPVFRASGG